MPVYKNRPPLSPGADVWHYTTTEAVVAILRERRLRLRRIDKWRDPFEGSVPKQQIDDQIPIFSGAQAAEMMMGTAAAQYPEMPTFARRVQRHRDPWQRMTQRRLATT